MRLDRCKIEQFFGEWDGAIDYLACASDVDSLSLGELLEIADPEALRLWHALDLGYTDPWGHPLLREAIADLHPTLAPDEVTVCGGGAVEALFLVANALLDVGDHAIVVWPAFESLHRIAPSLGATITPVPLAAAGGWGLDVDAVRAAIQPNTRALFINFPHNPTGALPDLADFKALLALARQSGITVVSDEVYRHLEHDPADTLPAACDLDETAISIGVMSKAYALAGLRVGWLATRNQAITDASRVLKDYTTVCASAPAEILSLIALRAHLPLLQRSRGIISDNLIQASSFFARHHEAFDWQPPAAGMLAFPRLTLPISVDDFVEDLARSKRVLLLPDRVFDMEENRFRIGLGRSDLPTALHLIEDYLTSIEV